MSSSVDKLKASRFGNNTSMDKSRISSQNDHDKSTSIMDPHL